MKTTLNDLKKQGYFLSSRSDLYGNDVIDRNGIRNGKRGLWYRNCFLAVSKHAWGIRGFKIKDNQMPHAIVSKNISTLKISYFVYRHDQVTPEALPVKFIPNLTNMGIKSIVTNRTSTAG